VNKARMYAATQKDFSNATELADYLAAKGLPFRQAHEIVGKLVLHCTQQGCSLQDLPLTEFQTISPLIESDLYDTLLPETAVKRRNSLGGTGFDQVEIQIEQAIRQLKIDIN